MNTGILSDSWTIVIKEWREWFGARTRPVWLVLLCVIAAWGILAPRMLGHFAAGPWLIVIVWAILPMTLAAVMVTDSIAGERERQTLETLLSSRLPNCAIILGKMAAAILLGWALLVVSPVLGATIATLDGFGAHAGLSFGALSVVELVLGVPAVVLVVCLGALLAIYLPGARVSLLLTSAFVGSLALGAFALAVWWVSSGGGASEIALATLVTGVALLDVVLLVWLLRTAHRYRLLAIG